jgi:hypothetical protein
LEKLRRRKEMDVRKRLKVKKNKNLASGENKI